MDVQKKSKAISEILRQEILNGNFDAVRKLPSDRMLMRRFAVARATVQAAMKDLIEKKLVDRKPGYGTYLVDRAEISAARRFGVIMPDAYYPFYARICHGIESGAKSREWSILSASLGSGSLKDQAIRALDFAGVCQREKVSGVFFQPLQFLKDSEKFNRAILNVFRQSQIPVVLLDSDFVTPPRRSEYDLVGIDNTNVGYLLARHLIEVGAKRLIYFSSPLLAPSSLKRGHGVGIAVNEANLRWRSEDVFFADPCDVRAAKRLFSGKRRPDAIVAVNDYIASLLLKTLRSIGVRVPEDVLLASVNGDVLAEEADPPITTAVQPCERIGLAAVDLMLQRIADPGIPPREVYFAVSVVARKSTKRKA